MKPSPEDMQKIVGANEKLVKELKEPRIELIQGDCLEKMKDIPDGSIDAIITDPPYGITACKWDSVIPFEPMWEQLKRIIKPNGAIALFGTEPFSSMLRMSNLKEYRYDWIWEKTNATNFWFVKKQPANKHELISIFYSKQPTYNPQMMKGKPYTRSAGSKRWESNCQRFSYRKNIKNDGTRYPQRIQRFSNGNNKYVHPTQKPVALIEYLVKTYTNEGETVLDFTMGSGTTGVACNNLNRNFIGIELNQEYIAIATERIQQTINQKELF